MKLGRAVLALLVVAACTADTLPPKGQLMLVVTTNLAPPKDFDAFRLRIVEDGNAVPIHDLEYAMTGSQATKLPATLGVVAGSDPNRVVRISVEAMRGGVVRIRRDAITRVPLSRVASLPLAIDGLCVESQCPDKDGRPQTCIAGSCQSAELDPDGLRDFSREATFGGGTGSGDGSCFDTIDCFSRGKVTQAAADCSVAKEAGAGFNVAVLQPPGSDGICAGNACLFPLDPDPFTGPVVTGWREVAGRVNLPIAVCDRKLRVMVTTSCPTKSAPTCGPWSAVGKASGLDASLPIEGAGDGGLPPNVPQAITFADEDPREGFVKGTVTITRAPDESAVTAYRLYWADGPSTRLDPIATLPKTGADPSFSLVGPMFPASSHLIAAAVSGSAELEPHVVEGPIDNFVRQTSISVNGAAISVPHLFVDASDESVLIVGHDKNPARNLPALIRCKLDGTACVYRDLSNGEAPNASGRPTGATLDATNGKLLVVVDTWVETPRLYRCNRDGTACEGAKALGAPAGSSPIGYQRVPVVIDETNKKLLAAFSDGNQGMLYRCDLDGSNCTYPTFGSSMVSQADADIVIDKAGGKLLVVRPNAANSVPFLYRCELDGTSCGVKDISAGDLTPAGPLSIAIDEDNHKLLVVTARVNGPTFQFYRCNLDGTACVTRTLVNPPQQAPDRPHVVVDANHKKLFVFGDAERGFFQRCELDGTACTLVYTTASVGAQSVRAVLHDGKLLSVGTSLTNANDFAMLFAY